MDFFKRMGTDRHKFKVEFFLGKLQCNAKIKGEVYITIKRGERKLSTEGKHQLSGGACDFGKEIITFEALTLFYDQDQKQYQQKQGEIRIILLTNKGDKKLLGNIEFDVAEFANSNTEFHKVTKEVGEKIKVTLEYEVYVKYIGEASQTSKSIDAKLAAKGKKSERESSLSKFVGFFRKNSGSGESENQEQDCKKQSKGNKQKRTESPQATNPKLTKKPGQEASKHSNQQARTERKNVPLSKKSGSDSEEFFDSPPEQHKNKVQKNPKGTLTEWEPSEPQIHSKSNKWTNGSPNPTTTQVYFDEYLNSNQQQSTAKASSTLKVKGTDLKEDPATIEDLRKQIILKEQQLQKKQQEMQLIRQQCYDLQQKNEELSKQLKCLNEENDHPFKMTKKVDNNQDSKKIKNLEREKGQLLVKLENLQEKYSKDFKKYEESVNQIENDKINEQGTLKGELARLREEASKQRDKYDRLLAKYEQQAKQAKNYKKVQDELRQQLSAYQQSLSTLKIKIGESLNKANEDGDKSAIDILTDLQ